MAVSPSPGRRELNKTRTREALVAALRRLAQQRPLPEITVDQVAEEADVSRRTFFNYFGSIPAVLTEVFAEHAAQIVDRVDPALLRQDPIAAMRAIVRAGGIPEELITWCAVLNSHGDSGDASVLIERAVWADLAAWLEGVLTDIFPEDTDPLYVSTLASGVMSAFSAAEQSWLAGLGSPARPTAADLHAFHDHLDQALSHLAAGWRPTT